MKNSIRCSNTVVVSLMAIVIMLSGLRGAATAAQPDPDADFQARCSAPGVVKCVGFDSAADIDPFIYPDSGGVLRAARDTSVKASGSSSLRFEIPSRSGANSSGNWKDSLGGSFGPGKTFYVQFRQRFSPEMLNTNFGGNGWKQVIFHYASYSCAALEITTQNTYLRGYPQMYTHCGAGSFAIDLGNGDFLYENGDYNCHRSNPNATGCAFYYANEWMTFYYEVKVGNWGQPNSSVKAWVAYEGGPMKQFVNAPNYTLDQDAPGREFNSLTLLPYNTDKPSGQTNPVAYTWHDELIVSTQPIAAPAGGTIPPPDSTAPAIPTGLSATAASSTQVNLSWTASTDNVAVTGYNIYRGTSKVGSSTTTTYQDIGLTANTTYSYQVSAYDAAGNESAKSTPAVSITTLGASIIYGDVSGNNQVTSYDASLAAQYAVGLIILTPEQITKADTSGNGTVSALDASLIAQFAAGLITKFPVQGG